MGRDHDDNLVAHDTIILKCNSMKLNLVGTCGVAPFGSGHRTVERIYHKYISLLILHWSTRTLGSWV